MCCLTPVESIPGKIMRPVCESMMQIRGRKYTANRNDLNSSDFKVRLENNSRAEGRGRPGTRENGEIFLYCLPEKLNPFK